MQTRISQIDGMALDMFFQPQSIALIGASRTPGKIGYTILENLKTSFPGKIYPINPEANEIGGLMTYPSVSEVPEPIDLAIIAVKAGIVPKVLDECNKKKIGHAIIISAGFREIGNKEAELELEKSIKGKNIRVIGPNCLGVFTKGLDTLFMPKDKMKRPVDGAIGFLSQSGAVGSTILDLIGYEGVGISKFVSYGNAVDINELDLLDYLGKDLNTRAIAMYLETVHNGPEFIKIASKISKEKPIVVLKAGKTNKGTEAVSSHTGSLAGPAEIYSAAFRQSGVIEAKTTEELFDYAKALATQPPLKSGRIAILTDGGGFGILAADSAILNRLELPDLSSNTVKKMQEFMPSYATIRNPVDLTGDANAERYEKALEIVMKDPSIDGILVIALVQVPQLEENVVDMIRDAKIAGKPIVACMMGGEYSIKQAKRLEGFGVPVYETPERAVRALSVLRQYGKMTLYGQQTLKQATGKNRRMKHKASKKTKRRRRR